MDDTAVTRSLDVRRVRDVMTSHPLTVGPDTGFRDTVRMLCQAGVDTLPVVQDGRLVGLVSADDLLLKEEMVEMPRGGTGMPWQRHRDRVRAAGRCVADMMCAKPPTVPPDATVGHAAHVMHRAHRGGLPVVDEHGALVGIVTRTDLLSVFLRDDTAVRAEVDAVLASLAPQARAEVEDGCVRLSGRVKYSSQASSLASAVRQLPGVVAVDCAVQADTDDLAMTGY